MRTGTAKMTAKTRAANSGPLVEETLRPGRSVETSGGFSFAAAAAAKAAFSLADADDAASAAVPVPDAAAAPAPDPPAEVPVPADPAAEVGAPGYVPDAVGEDPNPFGVTPAAQGPTP